VPPEARDVLAHFDQRSQHYEIREERSGNWRETEMGREGDTEMRWQCCHSRDQYAVAERGKEETQFSEGKQGLLMIFEIFKILLIIALAFGFVILIAYVLQWGLVERNFYPQRHRSYRGPRYPKLTENLWSQLERIPPSHDHGVEYRPCRVSLVNGKRVDCVYVVAEGPYFKIWGVWPEEDRRKGFIHIQDVAEIGESPSRLPPAIADELYQAGESGMGYYRFTLVFSDGFSQAYVTGDAVDFVPFPVSKTNKDILKVLPNTASSKNVKRGLKYYWCLYSEMG
jgi:hypothetical protein